ncbi:MAG: alpha/beta hydrolase [Anaerolineae bacterium]|jgi:pimeloyl-ACP methyl ester carboxylesterase|nr:alpha/beta hydrolase [Anaerolineae bacterium]
MSFSAAHFQTTDHVDLHYKTGKLCNSNVPTIFFCHGAGASPDQFTQQYGFAKEYCMVTPSLRGHGNSQMPTSINAESMSLLRLTLDMLELADHLDIKEFHFVGHSFGGLLGLELLKIAPERLLSLTVFGVSPCPKQSIVPDWLRANFSQWVSYNQLQRILGSSRSKNPSTVNAFTEMLKTANRKAVYSMLKSMVRHDYLEILHANTTTPILLLRSGEDGRINESLDPCLEKLGQQRNIDIIRVGSASHLINIETPEFFNNILSAFLTKAKVKDSKPLRVPPELQQ